MSFGRDAAGPVIKLSGPDGVATQQVQLILAAGRQHQVYLGREGDGPFRILPAIWATPKQEWLSTSLYQPGSLTPTSASYWKDSDLSSAGCVNCHVSQGHYRLHEGELRAAWVDSSINCESCHGPALSHVKARQSGQSGHRMRSLKLISPAQEARLCGQCHANRAPFRADTAEDGWPWFAYRTLADPYVRPDGTQRLTSYQLTGHLLSDCFQKGAAMCSSCHAPHTLHARSLAGASAEDSQVDRQCTVCHRDKQDPQAAKRHTHHKGDLSCIDCHMAPSWIGDSPARQQRTADHTISIPRPRESIQVGTPNACTTCHDNKSAAWALQALEAWGAEKASKSRPWVLAVDAARRQLPAASAALVRLLEAPDTGPFLRDSALDLLASQPVDPTITAGLEPFAEHPSPQSRGLALRALHHHDILNRAAWLARAAADSHAYPRMWATRASQQGKQLPRPQLERFEADAMEWRQRPLLDDILFLIQAWQGHGEGQRARYWLSLSEQVLTPRERAAPRLKALHLRLNEASGVKADHPRPWAR